MKYLQYFAFFPPMALLAGCSGIWNYVDKPALSTVGTQNPLHEALGELFTTTNAPLCRLPKTRSCDGHQS